MRKAEVPLLEQGRGGGHRQAHLLGGGLDLGGGDQGLAALLERVALVAVIAIVPIVGVMGVLPVFHCQRVALSDSS